ncbi:Hypothetical protein D9617_6g093270 [Elsinoe fawcettii]|nr:Hypothetical protein D9617_6g093270 [Elsinoe fawcettii]
MDSSNQVGLRMHLASWSYGSLLFGHGLSLAAWPSKDLTNAALVFQVIQQRRAMFLKAGIDPSGLVELPSMSDDSGNNAPHYDTVDIDHPRVSSQQDYMDSISETAARRNRILRLSKRIDKLNPFVQKKTPWSSQPEVRDEAPSTDQEVMAAMQAEKQCLLLDQVFLTNLIQAISQPGNSTPALIHTYQMRVLRSLKVTFRSEVEELDGMLAELVRLNPDLAIQVYNLQDADNLQAELRPRTLLTLQLITLREMDAIAEHNERKPAVLSWVEQRVWERELQSGINRANATFNMLVWIARSNREAWGKNLRRKLGLL